MQFVAAISQGFRTSLKLDAILLRQKLHRVAATKIACVNGPLPTFRKCRRVWNKPWPSRNFCAERCRRKTEIQYSTRAAAISDRPWDLYDKDSTSLGGIEEYYKAACSRIWYISRTENCFRRQWTRYIGQRHPERISKRRLSQNTFSAQIQRCESNTIKGKGIYAKNRSRRCCHEMAEYHPEGGLQC